MSLAAWPGMSWGTKPRTTLDRITETTQRMLQNLMHDLNKGNTLLKLPKAGTDPDQTWYTKKPIAFNLPETAVNVAVKFASNYQHRVHNICASDLVGQQCPLPLKSYCSRSCSFDYEKRPGQELFRFFWNAVVTSDAHSCNRQWNYISNRKWEAVLHLL